MCAHACGSRRGAERKGEKQCRFHIVSTEPDVGLEPMNHEIMTRAKIKNWMFNRLSHRGTPVIQFFRTIKTTVFVLQLSTKPECDSRSSSYPTYLYQIPDLVHSSQNACRYWDVGNGIFLHFRKRKGIFKLH